MEFKSDSHLKQLGQPILIFVMVLFFCALFGEKED